MSVKLQNTLVVREFAKLVLHPKDDYYSKTFQRVSITTQSE